MATGTYRTGNIHGRGRSIEPWLIGISWASWGAALFSLSLQYFLEVYHAYFWLWFPFAVLGAIASLACLGRGLWKAVVGPRRVARLGWGVFGAIPLAAVAAFAGHLIHTFHTRVLPDSLPARIIGLAGDNLLEWHAKITYPHCLQSRRLVMYYDDAVTEPAADLAALEEHLARLEEILQRRQHSPIHLVRGSALGQKGLTIYSVALGSEDSPAYALDRHELAHAFMVQFTHPSAKPPTALIEGWAMAVDGHPPPPASQILARRVSLADLLGPDLYHDLGWHVYYIGGPWVDFLLRRHGPEKFLEFFNTCRVQTSQADFECVYGIPFAEMEGDFWHEFEAAAKQEVKQ